MITLDNIYIIGNLFYDKVKQYIFLYPLGEST